MQNCSTGENFSIYFVWNWRFGTIQDYRFFSSTSYIFILTRTRILADFYLYSDDLMFTSETHDHVTCVRNIILIVYVYNASIRIIDAINHLYFESVLIHEWYYSVCHYMFVRVCSAMHWIIAALQTWSVNLYCIYINYFT